MLFILTIAWLAGHLLVLFVPALVPAHLLLSVPTLLLALIGQSLRGADFHRCRAAAIVFLLGVMNAGMAAHVGAAQRLDPLLAGQKVWVEGVVSSLPKRTGDGVTFVLDEVRVKGQGQGQGQGQGHVRRDFNVPGRIQVSWFRSARIPAAGEHWILHLRLRAARGALNPGGPDIDGWYFREGIGARASVVRNEATRQDDRRLARPFLRLRALVVSKIKNHLDGHPMSGVVIGLATGVRDDISTQQWRLMRLTGTGHLVAISGLHVGLISGLIFLCVRFVWGTSALLSSRIAPVDAARPVAMLAGIAYAMLAGFALPTRRALLMLALWYGAGALRRPVAGFRILGISLFVFLAVDPLCLLSPGFWLSFGAVATLILATRKQTTGRVRRLLLTQARIFAGVAPIGLAVFGKVSVVAPVANALMIPLFAVVLIPLVLIASLTLLAWPLAGGFLIQVCAQLATAIWLPLQRLGQSQFLEFSAAGRAWLIAGLTLAGLLLLLPGWPGKRRLLGALAAAFLLAPHDRLESGSVEATVLDSGHALSVVVRTRRKALVYDLGSGRGEQSDVARILLPFLESKGIGHPDVLILSHDDARHLGDPGEFLNRFPGVSVISGAPVAAGALLQYDRVARCRPGINWRWDGVGFEILQPGREVVWEDDDSSCVLLVTTPSLRLLVTGDLGAQGERKLLQRYPQLTADVVIGLAHGRSGAGSQALAKALQARLAVISTAIDNPWGLPTPAVRQRWRAQGTVLLNSGAQGAITIRAERNWRYSCYRDRRFWHRH